MVKWCYSFFVLGLVIVTTFFCNAQDEITNTIKFKPTLRSKVDTNQYKFLGVDPETGEELFGGALWFYVKFGNEDSVLTYDTESLEFEYNFKLVLNRGEVAEVVIKKNDVILINQVEFIVWGFTSSYLFGIEYRYSESHDRYRWGAVKKVFFKNIELVQKKSIITKPKTWDVQTKKHKN